jgi:hypothetical protein
VSYKLMPLSFSRLSTFEQCEAKFEYLHVTKTVKDSNNQYSAYGDRVHKALEMYGKARVSGEASDMAIADLEGNIDEVRPWLPLVDKIISKDGTKDFELQLAATPMLQPCEWFSNDVWIRSIVDVLVRNGSRAFCGDWKTGKVKANPTQLQLFAAMIFAHYPEIDTVDTCFIWLAHNELTSATYTRDKSQHLWDALKPRFARVQQAVDIGVFKAKPSGLCGWCPARAICGDAR